MHKIAVSSALAASVMLAASAVTAQAQGVKVVPDEANRRVDVTIDGKPFTSYIWPTTLKKPVLYPLIDADGVTVSRGYPLAPLPGERVDHPHHAGLWFNYGNANGFDFWNNSDAIKPEERPKYGTVTEQKIVSVKSGPDVGELVAESTWVTGKGEDLIHENARYVFARGRHSRSIDLIVTLTALDKVVFNDDKEGMLGMRVASWLESPEEKGGIYQDANGKQTKVDGATPGASGEYLTSEGVKGEAAWATRGRWCALTGHKDNHEVTIAIFDHPKNPGYPTYWHARGYGLFAANPLGRSIFDTKQPAFNFTLDKGQSATFRYRVVIGSGAAVPKELNKQADAFAAEYK